MQKIGDYEKEIYTEKLILSSIQLCASYVKKERTLQMSMGRNWKLLQNRRFEICENEERYDDDTLFDDIMVDIYVEAVLSCCSWV